MIDFILKDYNRLKIINYSYKSHFFKIYLFFKTKNNSIGMTLQFIDVVVCKKTLNL
jgi:hypothetical protein